MKSNERKEGLIVLAHPKEHRHSQNMPIVVHGTEKDAQNKPTVGR